MFDPFKDFDTAGYLRNTFQEKDLNKVKRIEHDLFWANVEDAINYLSSQEYISYEDFLKVHEILFVDFYPWAGKDRSETSPNISVFKGDVYFSHPFDIRRAIETGLMIGQDPHEMKKKTR